MNPRGRKLCYLALPMLVVAACVFQPALAHAQMTSLGVSCSDIQKYGIDKQENMRAGRIMIECGLAQAGHPTDSSNPQVVPPNVRVSNRTCSSNQSCTKSENMIWGSTKNAGKTLVDNFNDDNPGGGSNYSGTSYSLDGGKTWHQINPSPFATGHGTNFGDPIVVFNSKKGLFFAGDLVTGCGGQGVGLWTSPDGKTWTTGACAHNGSFDDRESMWVDNEPTSGTYGRMYVSFNDFNNNAALSLMYSDDGTTWNGPVIISNTATFMRNVQLTGTPAGTKRFEGKNSTVFVAGMDEGGGGCNTRQNNMFKSLDGGLTWTAIVMGPRFASICGVNCGYFTGPPPIWRHMGWGQPAVGPNGVVHYDFAGAGSKNGDPGDVYYTRSKDNGKTWSTPIKLNTDKDSQFAEQWMPSLSVDKTGDVTASWYDRRKATSACVNVTDPGCKYERVGRQSKTNGATFLPAITISSAIIPQPAQDDPFIQSCYAGDYDNDNTNNAGSAYVTWTDGRRSVGGVNVQDVEFAKVPEP